MKNEKTKNEKDIKEAKPKALEGKEGLRVQITTLQEELHGLRIEHAQGKLKNTSYLTVKRKEIARLLTSLRIMELTQ